MKPEWTPEEIERFRKKAGLTRKALGELLGVTVNCIYQWERSLRTPSMTTKLLLTRVAADLKAQGKAKE